jgi:hypothetical protein
MGVLSMKVGQNNRREIQCLHKAEAAEPRVVSKGRRVANKGRKAASKGPRAVSEERAVDAKR